ncbi:UDP-2,3-diacylglucosamine diphosphatase [Curvibacter sp. PAE-UM]|uniref:UDP-2,3-diacylglucosamine diphosphatase n=1 Tax=Curvibacter sp. PAE-UM TaxID=1714344 RepID=UPI00070BD951|nr:UDP-2,3-diacylglucosamine diphosphatase [Curvibacter sp. PAE-UM]KRI01174.1 UDP-2,3-diacylglucosamine hydrolase [Curvibacter sp. PAE-UM]
MTPTTPRFAELHAPAHWRVVDFISDLHLQATEPRTAQAWEHYMAGTRADAVFILGDLFEVWVGDDGLQAEDEEARFEQHCVDVMKATASRCALHFMHGNRDFLLGTACARATGFTLLDDPCVLVFGGQRWLLTHGDALCLDDADYLQFRAQVRTANWQQAFLAKPLAERRALARGLRQQSEDRKQSGMTYADVDTPITRDWLRIANAGTMIHGHTHRPADHDLGRGQLRHVLSDWDAAAQPPRAEVLRLQRSDPTGAVRVLRLPASDIA